jgi:hypothetical protein
MVAFSLPIIPVVAVILVVLVGALAFAYHRNHG